MFAGLGLEVLIAFAKRYWKPILLGVIGLGIVATITIQHWRIGSLEAARVSDKIAIDAAVTANAQNTRAIADLQRAAEIDRQTTADAAEQTRRLVTTAEPHIQEIQRDPDANVAAGPEFDDLGDRLRAIDAGRH